MTYQEKEELLNQYEDLPQLTSEHLDMLIRFSEDSEPLIRSRVAELLINFENEEAKETLLNLARDKDELVRTEAYDSLCFFEDIEVEEFLEQKIEEEENKIACSYAILSWADVAVTLHDDFSLLCHRLEEIQQIPKVRKSEHCLLSCCYAQYVFGDETALEEIVEFYGSEDYHIRCSVTNLLKDLADDYNKEFIKDAVEQMLEKEEVNAVKLDAKKFLAEME